MLNEPDNVKKTLKIFPGTARTSTDQIGNIWLNQFQFPLNPYIEPFPT
jgi:hypothetical protein